MTEPTHQLDYANLKGQGGLLREPASQNVAWRIIKAIVSEICWTFFAFIVVGGLLMALSFIGTPIMVPAGLIVALTLIPMVTIAMRTIRRRRGLALLGYVRQAVRLNLPLQRVLNAAMASESGKLRNRLGDFATLLQMGMPISAAIAAGVPEVSPRVVGKLRLAEQTGRFSQELSRILDDEAAVSRDAQKELNPLEQWYPPVILASIAFCIWITAVFTLPRFGQVMRDSKVPVPFFFRRADEWSDWMLPIAPLVVLTLLVIAGRRLREAVTDRQPTHLFRGFRDRILWSLPITHGFAKDRAMTDICGAMADSIDAGFSIETVLHRSGELQLNAVMNQRLQKWTAGLTAGMPVADAAKSAKIPTLLVQFLRTSAAHPAEVFRFVGRFYQARLDRRGAILRGLYLPVVISVLGLCVMCVALAIFQPMQALITSAGSTWGGP